MAGRQGLARCGGTAQRLTLLLKPGFAEISKPLSVNITGRGFLCGRESALVPGARHADVWHMPYYRARITLSLFCKRYRSFRPESFADPGENTDFEALLNCRESLCSLRDVLILRRKKLAKLCKFSVHWRGVILLPCSSQRLGVLTLPGFVTAWTFVTMTGHDSRLHHCPLVTPIPPPS